MPGRGWLGRARVVGLHSPIELRTPAEVSYARDRVGNTTVSGRGLVPIQSRAVVSCANRIEAEYLGTSEHRGERTLRHANGTLRIANAAAPFPQAARLVPTVVDPRQPAISAAFAEGAQLPAASQLAAERRGAPGRRHANDRLPWARASR